MRKRAMWIAFCSPIVLCAAELSTAAVLGRYSMRNGNFFVASRDGNEVRLSLFASSGMNSCHIETGPLKFGNASVDHIDDAEDCRLHVTFKPGGATVAQTGGCGCGLNVSVRGDYSKAPRASRKSPSRK